MIKSPRDDGTLEDTIGLRSICADTCYTCDDNQFKQTESSRDLWLILTLESVKQQTILARRKISFWPKATITPRELNKQERRRPKGGAAKLVKQQKQRADQTQPTSPTSSNYMPENIPGHQTFNLLIPVESKGNAPSTNDLMDACIKLAIKNARKLNLEHTDFMRRVETIAQDGPPSQFINESQ
jgi:hypothetical protein